MSTVDSGRSRSVRWLILSAAVAFVLMAGACSDDDPVLGPGDRGMLGQLGLELVVAQPSLILYDTVTAEVGATNADEAALEGLTFRWGWGEGTGYWARATGLAFVVLQPREVGTFEVRVEVSDGVDRLELAMESVVEAPPVSDGSLDLVPIRGGAFLRGDRPEDTRFDSFTPQRTITLSPYRIARTEMTNATFAAAVNFAAARRSIWTVEGSPYLFWRPTVDAMVLMDLSRSDLDWNGDVIVAPTGRELHPVTGVRWYGAATVCNWLSEMAGLDPVYTFTPSDDTHRYEVRTDFGADGYRLPTEAEWEKAARGGLAVGGSENPLPARAYPWGNEPIRAQTTFGSTYSRFANTGAPELGPLYGGVLPVGSFPLGRSPYGVVDLIGNVSEWCNDWYAWNYYEDAPTTDPRGTETFFPAVDAQKVIRGDSYRGPYMPSLEAWSFEDGCAKRRSQDFHSDAAWRGFRVVRGGL